ncbi:SRPBCC family protein [Paenibacillus sp. SYP-B4298]|uniref:SRPBCC family protein n=1 Tax=Paenibacillus sp. SYP-B4298 TaxID=2996034 RepID=UPI0022DCF1ED|nr:SRPBCC domain-containing protein [Paenibacillus sp. SYP-B4298]
MSLTLTMDFQFTTSIDKLWSALTDAGKLSKWVANIHTGEGMDNNFKPVVGHHFQFRTQPTEYWSGIIEGEVLVVDAPSKLSYTWESGEKHLITWTLNDLGDGRVNLHLEQSGISNEQALGGAKYGWGKWCAMLDTVLQ